MAFKVTGSLLVAMLVAGAVGAVAGTGAIWALHTAHPEPADLHSLLHKVVPLDAAEETRLDAKEREYTAHREAIEARMKAANARLASAIHADPRWSPEVEAVTKEVEAAAAELQRVTLEHVFEMREGLDPGHRAAYDKALIDALDRGAK